MTPLWVHCERDHSAAHLQSLPRCLFGSPCGSLLCGCPQPPPLCSLVLLCLTALRLRCFEGLKSQVIFQMYLLVFMQGAEFFSKIPPSPLPPPFSLCVCVSACGCHGTHVEIRGQPQGFSPHIPQCDRPPPPSQGLLSGWAAPELLGPPMSPPPISLLKPLSDCARLYLGSRTQTLVLHKHTSVLPTEPPPQPGCGHLYHY